MNPSRGQLVEIRFNNGVFFDAVVEDWSDQKSIVKLTSSGEMVIIQKTLQDVLLVKIINRGKEEQLIEPEQEPNVYLGRAGMYIPGMKPIVIDNTAKEAFDDLRSKPITSDSLDRMVDLKDELNKIERQEMFGDISIFKPNGVREVSYGIPRNIQISSTAQYTDEEITSADSEFNSGLQELFYQKH